MITEEYIPTYGEQGFLPIIIHVGDQLSFGCDLARTYGLDMPLLLDSDDSLLNIFQQVGLDSVLFPLAYLIDGDNVVAHVYNEPESEDAESTSPETLIEDLEDLLGL